MYCMVPFAGYPGKGKYVSAEDTEVAAIAWSWMLITKGHRYFFRLGGILYLTFGGGHTIAYVCQHS